VGQVFTIDLISRNRFFRWMAAATPRYFRRWMPHSPRAIVFPTSSSRDMLHSYLRFSRASGGFVAIHHRGRRRLFEFIPIASQLETGLVIDELPFRRRSTGLRRKL